MDASYPMPLHMQHVPCQSNYRHFVILLYIYLAAPVMIATLPESRCMPVILSRVIIIKKEMCVKEKEREGEGKGRSR